MLTLLLGASVAKLWGNLPFSYGFSLVMGPILLRRSAILCQNVTSN